MKKNISFKLNGKSTAMNVEEDRGLIWVLRTDCGLTGTKFGCGTGICGSCTIVVDGKAVRSCRMTISDVEGKEVVTIEGLARGDQLHPLQQAFVEQGAVQCGFCTPGMIMNAYAMLLDNPALTREQIITGMENNLCRCGAHKRIVEAIESVAAAK
jgi:aerobic-type carbon monoxide dehydrogenase small subunit (CoxS/CutS family)